MAGFSYVSGLITSCASWGLPKPSGRFQFFLCQPAERPKSSSKRLLAGILPKIAVSSASYISGSFLCQRFNGQLALVQMPKNAVPKDSWPGFGPKCRFQSFFCQRFNNQLGPAQIQLPQAPGHDFAQHGRFQLSYVSGLITIWSLPKFQNPAPKGSWPAFGPKWPFPVFPRS